MTPRLQTPRTVRGRPMLAEGDEAARIVADIARMSEPFGTTVESKDGAGVVRLGVPAGR